MSSKRITLNKRTIREKELLRSSSCSKALKSILRFWKLLGMLGESERIKLLRQSYTQFSQIKIFLTRNLILMKG